MFIIGVLFLKCLMWYTSECKIWITFVDTQLVCHNSQYVIYVIFVSGSMNSSTV